MSSISRLKNNIQNFEAILNEYIARLKENPNNFSIKLSIENLQSQLGELRTELQKENLKREKEIIRFRLLGDIAKYGSMPLETLANVASSFSEAITQTSKYIKYGNKYVRNSNEIIKSLIDLRIADIEQGSTVLFLTGNISPDLFGYSVIQDSLENIFLLLQSENEEQISENINVVGPKSIRGFSRLFSHLSEKILDLDLSWESPDDKVYNWIGDQEKIHSLYNTFDKVNISKPEDIFFDGELITISLKRKFEIRDKDKFTYYGTFPIDLLEKIKELHIGTNVKGIISKTTFYNPLTDKEKHEYILKKISTN